MLRLNFESKAFSAVVAKRVGSSWIYEEVFSGSHGNRPYIHTSLDLTRDPDGSLWIAGSFGENRVGSPGGDTYLFVYKQNPGSNIWNSSGSAVTGWPKFRAIEIFGGPQVVDKILWAHNPIGSTFNSKRPILFRETVVKNAEQVAGELNSFEIEYVVNPIGDLNSGVTNFRRFEERIEPDGVTRKWKRVIPTPIVNEKPPISDSIRALISSGANARLHISLYTQYFYPVNALSYFKSPVGSTSVPILDTVPYATSANTARGFVIQANQQPFLACTDGTGDIEKQFYDGTSWSTATTIPSTDGLIPTDVAILPISGYPRVLLLGSNSSVYESTNGIKTTIILPGAPFSLAHSHLVTNGDADTISLGVADGTAGIHVFKQP